MYMVIGRLDRDYVRWSAVLSTEGNGSTNMTKTRHAGRTFVAWYTATV